MKKLIYLLTLLIFANSCSKAKIDKFEEVYEIEMIGNWSATTHPIDFPSNAHFSPLVALSHVAGLDVIGEGLSATEGIKSMAETGNTEQLIKEFIKFQNQNYSIDTAVGKSFSSPGSTKVQIGVKRGYHTVSIFSMLAPSPDWFVAATTSLLDAEDGNWYDKVTVKAKVYDAGTDSGTTFTSANLVTEPKETIHELTTGPLTNGTDSVRNIVTFIFTRVKK